MGEQRAEVLRAAHRRPYDRAPIPVDVGDVQRGRRAPGVAEGHECAAPPEQRQCRSPRRAAVTVDDDVERAAGALERRLRPVGTRVHRHRLRAEGNRSLPFLFAARRHYDARSGGGGHLDEEGRDSSARTGDEDAIAGLDPATGEQGTPRRQAREGERTGLLPAEPGGARCHVAGGHNYLLGERAVRGGAEDVEVRTGIVLAFVPIEGRVEHDLVAGSDTRHVVTHGHHHTCAIRSERDWQRAIARRRPHPGVPPVQRRRHHLHHHLPRARLRVVQLAHLETGRISKGDKTHGSHERGCIAVRWSRDRPRVPPDGAAVLLRALSRPKAATRPACWQRSG